MRREVERIDPALPVYGVETMEEQVGKSLVLARLAASFLGVFGFLALTLAAVGLYGMMSYTVAARTREIAIRMALGASAARAISMLAQQGLGAVGVGLAVGLAAGLAVGRLVSSLLYGVGSFDALTFIAVPIVLVCRRLFRHPIARASRDEGRSHGGAEVRITPRWAGIGPDAGSGDPMEALVDAGSRWTARPS